MPEADVDPVGVLRDAERAVRSTGSRPLRPGDWDEVRASLTALRQAFDRRDLPAIAAATDPLILLGAKRQQRRVDTERVAPPEPVRTTADQLARELAELARKYDSK
jgi:hypothetical protein